MGFADTFFGVMGEARRPTLELVSRLDVAAIARPWLVMLYQVIRDTGPMLDDARSRSAMEVFGWKTVGHALWDFYETKGAEEDGHADMLLADLHAAGISGAETAPVNPFVAEMCGRQNYLIRHVHPAVYLGYIGLLEGFPPTLEQIDALEKTSGLAPAAFRTARLHAEVDVRHREELAKMLDVVPDALRTHILANGIRCAQLQRQAIEILSPTETQWTP